MADQSPKQPRIWVRVVEAHATRSWVAVILAASAGLSIFTLTLAAMWNTISDPKLNDLSSNYSSVITSTLGVLVGSLATYVGNAPTQQDPNIPPRDDEVILDVDHPRAKDTDDEE